MIRPSGVRLGRASKGLRFPRSAAVAGVLLQLAAACVPGEGPRPPSGHVLPPSFGGAGPVAGVSGGTIPPPPGAAGMIGAVAGTESVPPVGGGGVPIGTGGTGVGAGVGSPPPVGGTGGIPLPDSGMGGGFNPGTDPNRNLVQAGTICDRWTTLQCAAEEFCCSNPGRTPSVCKSDLMMVCARELYVDDVAKNKASGFSMAHAKAALDQLEQYAAVCDPVMAAWSLTPAGFRGMFQGTVAPAGQCRPSGLPTPLNAGIALASCAQPETHACQFSGSGPTPSGGMCTPRGAAGATCFMDINCAEGLFCANTAMTFTGGVCTAHKPVGSPCSGSNECMTQICKSAACAAATADNAYCLKP